MPVTRNQVELMQVDNVCSPGLVFIVTRLALCVPTIDTPESSFRKRQRGCLGYAATLRYPSPLIKPGVPISGTREIQLNCSLAVLEWRVK